MSCCFGRSEVADSDRYFEMQTFFINLTYSRIQSNGYLPPSTYRTKYTKKPPASAKFSAFGEFRDFHYFCIVWQEDTDAMQRSAENRWARRQPSLESSLNVLIYRQVSIVSEYLYPHKGAFFEAPFLWCCPSKPSRPGINTPANRHKKSHHRPIFRFYSLPL